MKLKNEFFVHPSAIIDENCKIGSNTKIWHFSHLMSGCEIGSNCNIGQNVVIMPKVILGDYVKVQNNVSIYTGVICENFVFLGPSCVFTNILNPRSRINRQEEFKSTLLKEGASIGANATVLCGHVLGKYSMIGAGTVVTKNVPDYGLVIGNPGRLIGWVSESGDILKFNDSNIAECSENGEKYRLDNGIVKKITIPRNNKD